jgi:hypothetical protein
VHADQSALARPVDQLLLDDLEPLAEARRLALQRLEQEV